MGLVTAKFQISQQVMSHATLDSGDKSMSLYKGMVDLYKDMTEYNMVDVIDQLTGFYPKFKKSFWSCTHVNSCQNHILYTNLHILLNILSKATSNIQESRKSIKCLKR